jgi:beta-glucosidase
MPFLDPVNSRFLPFSISKKSFCGSMVLLFSLSLVGCNEAPISQGEPSSEPIEQAEEKVRTVPDYWPELKYPQQPEPELANKIDALLSSMTLEQKVAQMIQPEIRDITIDDMRQYGFGSYLNGGGAFPNDDKHARAEDWIKLADDMYQASVDDSLDGSTIPTMWGTDAVHGHNNVIGATLFPHNIGLGAARNPKLIQEIAKATAREVAVTGIDWVFAPTVAVVRDDRWGRAYEGYSEDPEIVKAYSKAIVNGLQGGLSQDFLGEERVIATVKHFLGDGGTEKGDDQGNNIASEQELFELHAQGYVSGLNAGAQTVMASFNSWHGKKNHGSHYLLTQVLKQRMGFDGLVVGDWNGHGQIPGCSNEKCSQSINAGLDIFMVPTDAWKPLYLNTIEQVKNSKISMDRIDDAVRRILRVKFRAGLFSKPRPAERALSAKTDIIGSKAHRLIARQAVRESLVLLKNKNQLLPLKPNQKIGITGDAADNIGKQSGGWSITWQGSGNTNQDFPGATSIYQGIKDKVEAAGGQVELSPSGIFNQTPDVAIVVFGEEPYAEGNGDLANLNFQRGNKKDLALIKQLAAQGIPVVSIFISGRPLWVNPEINASSSFVAAWLPGTEGAGVADVILAKQDATINHDFIGKLSFSWPNSPEQYNINRKRSNEFSEINATSNPPLLGYGFGLAYGESGPLAEPLNETISSDKSNLEPLNLMQYPWNFALQTGDKLERVTSSAIDTGLIGYRTIDRRIQEDARQIEYKGSQKSTKFEINDHFPFDLRNYLDRNASLSFDIKIEQPLNQPMLLSLRCENNCSKKVAINQYLSKIPSKDWQTIKINLSCLKRNGQVLDKVYAPFSLETSENVSIKLSDIKIVPDESKAKSAQCME